MSNPNGFLEIDNSLTYSYPVDIVSGDISFVSFKSDAVSYSPGQTASFNLRSNNEFMILDRSYIKFDITETGTTGTSLSCMGSSAIFKTVSDNLSGLQLPQLSDWNVLNSVNLSTDTAERKSVTTRCEATGTYAAPGTALAATTINVARSVVMPIPTTLSSISQVFPLALLSGGYRIDYQLEDYLKVFVGYVGNSYTITNFEIVGCMLKAPDAYLKEVSQGLAAGNSLKIPLQLTKNFTNLLSIATEQSINLSPGYLSSMNSLTNVYRTTATVNAASTDSFKSTVAKVKNFYMNVDSARYPRNKPINIKNSAGNEDPEFIYQLLASQNTSVALIEAPKAAISDVLHFSWKSNSSFNSGIPLNNGKISLEMQFSAAPAVNDILCSFIDYDCYLTISLSDVTLVTSL